MSQKLFNKTVGALILIKAITVGYYWLTGIKVVALFGPVARWVMLLVIIICIGLAYIAFTMRKKKKYVTQKLFDQTCGVLCGLDALASFYYLFFGVNILLGNWVFPIWLMLTITALDIYMFYTAFTLAKKIN